MHSRGSLLEISSYAHATYGEGVIGAVLRELGERMAAAVARGVAPETICLDPGFGFSKTVEQNVGLLDGLAALESLGRPLAVGPSRKRFVGVLAGREEAGERDRATATLCAFAWERGARIFRVHDVAAAREALAVAQALG
jgi:dihydropteroate synthase